MIAYDIQCGNGHSFEGWFEDAKTYQSQKKKRMIACPVCSTTEISRVPSKFAIKSTAPESRSNQEQTALAALGQKIVEYVDKNFDNVGCKFAKEALKIHYGVSEPRNIRGVSTQQEEDQLKEEGVEFFKIPLPLPADTDDA